MFDKQLILLLVAVAAIGITMLVVGPHETIDKKLYYSGDEARALFESYSEEQLQAYFYNELLDLLFLSCYTAAFVTAYRRLGMQGYLLLAILPGTFDGIETTGALYALGTLGPHQFFDWLGLITVLKWASIAVAAFMFRLKK